MSCRRNRSDSGLAARMAGEAIGADQFLVNTATEEFLSCLSRNALEAVAGEASVPLGRKIKDTRATLVAHFADQRFVHPAALIAPTPEEVRSFVAAFAKAEAEAGTLSEDGDPITARSEPEPDEADVVEDIESDFREAAE